jgi:hypothetical protein
VGIVLLGALLCLPRCSTQPPADEPIFDEAGDEPILDQAGELIFDDTIDVGVEGLSPEQADTIGAASFDIPTDLSAVVYGDLRLLDASGIAKTIHAPRDPAVPAFIFRMLVKGTELAVTPWIVGEGEESFTQDWGLSYVYGSKDETTIKLDATPKCDEFGLDCSGFIGRCVLAGGLAIGAGLGTDPLSKPKTYNDAIPADWNAVMVLIKNTPQQWLTGDLLIWTGHMGMAVLLDDPLFNQNQPATAHIWNSAGSDDFTCEQNRGWVWVLKHEEFVQVKRGPAAWPLEKYNIYHDKYQAALRLYDKPAVTFAQAVDPAIPNATRITATIVYSGVSGAYRPQRNRLVWTGPTDWGVTFQSDAPIVTFPTGDGERTVSTSTAAIMPDTQSPVTLTLDLRDPDNNDALIDTTMVTVGAAAGSVVVLEYLNPDGTTGTDASQAAIQLSGNLSSLQVSWTGVRAYALIVDRLDTEPPDYGLEPQDPFSFSYLTPPITYGDYGVAGYRAPISVPSVPAPLSLGRYLVTVRGDSSTSLASASATLEFEFR